MVLRGARLWQLQGPLCHREHPCLPKEPPRVLTFQVTRWHIPRSPWSLSVLLLSYCPQSLHGVFGRLFISRACSVLGAIVTLDHLSRKKEMLWGHSPGLAAVRGSAAPLRSGPSTPLCLGPSAPPGCLLGCWGGSCFLSACLSSFSSFLPSFPFFLSVFFSSFLLSFVPLFFFPFLSSPIFGCSF